MIKTVLAIVGWSCLAFSIVGMIETAIGLAKEGSYSLMRVIVYSFCFGIGISLILR